MRKYLEACKAVKVHGIKGAVRVKVMCDSPAVLVKIKTLYEKHGGEFTPRKVVRASVQKDMAIITLEGCETYEDAAALLGRTFFADRDDIPLKPGSNFVDDLIGLDVIDIDSGRVYGKLNDVIFGGPRDIYEIKTPDGKQALMPAVKEFVKKVECGVGIYVRPIEGMFDEV